MIRKSVAEILRNHVTLELEGIDRMYLNGYVPSLQTGAGFAYFLRNQLDCRVPSTYMIAPMSKQFVASIEQFVKARGVELVSFARGQRKDDVAREHEVLSPTFRTSRDAFSGISPTSNAFLLNDLRQS